MLLNRCTYQLFLYAGTLHNLALSHIVINTIFSKLGGSEVRSCFVQLDETRPCALLLDKETLVSSFALAHFAWERLRRAPHAPTEFSKKSPDLRRVPPGWGHAHIKLPPRPGGRRLYRSGSGGGKRPRDRAAGFCFFGGPIPRTALHRGDTIPAIPAQSAARARTMAPLAPGGGKGVGGWGADFAFSCLVAEREAG